MNIPNEAACLRDVSKRSNYLLAQYGEKMVQFDNTFSDYEHSISSSSYSSGIGSVDEKKIELRQYLSDRRKNCCKHLDNIDALIDNQFNNARQESVKRKYFKLQNEMIMQKRISETKGEIQKLKNSIYNEMVEQANFFENLKTICILIILLICASFSILYCWDEKVCYK